MIILMLTATLVGAQELRTTRLELSGPAWNGISGAIIGTREPIPLVLGTTSAIAQPIRFHVGPAGSERALEITGAAETWLRGPVAIGPTTGTIASAWLRIASIPPTSGTGLMVDLQGTQSSTGIAVASVGASGSDHAGIRISSSANGYGTGIRIGGPTGTDRPTLQTAIDITGGTGLRYNALYGGQGTGLEIGGTTSPQRGVDVRVSGSDQVGVFARANTLGSGLIGMSASGSYADHSVRNNTGVIGVAASNSSASADTLTGIHGIAQRGGNGGRSTTTIAVRAQTASIASQHSGTAIGLLAEAVSTSPGTAVSVAGLFRSSAGGLGLAVFDGDVYLGSSDGNRPASLSASTVQGAGTSTTYVYGLHSSGPRYRTGGADAVLGAGLTATIDAGPSDIIVVTSDAAGSELEGVTGGSAGRVLTIVNRGGLLILHDDGGGAAVVDRFILSQDADVIMPQDGAVSCWYDGAVPGWRIIGRSW